MILAGQPEFDYRLDSPGLRQLKQRIVLRCSLQPFNATETKEYILTRLSKAGMPDQTVLSDDLIHEIHVRSQGIARIINALCDNLLLTTFATESRLATLGMLDEICKDIRLEWPGQRRVNRANSYSAEQFEAARLKPTT